jgi:hypothetical protein
MNEKLKFRGEWKHTLAPTMREETLSPHEHSAEISRACCFH